MNEITINNQSIPVKEYAGGRVVTFKDIDTVHGRPVGTAGRAFRKNRGHFIEGEDYYKVTPDVFRRTFGEMDARQSNDVILITETGYLMLVKSFRDDLAWQVQRELVNGYFRKAQAEQLPAPAKLPGMEERAVMLAELEMLTALYQIEEARAKKAKCDLLRFVSEHPWLAEFAGVPELSFSERG